MTAPTRPVLRYHGGKFLLAKWIISHFPPHTVYVEPFAGAASVFMAKPRCKGAEVINDVDSEVVNVFRVLRNREQAAELERLIRLTPFAREEFRAAYELTDNPIERARQTIIRSFMGFGTSGVNKGINTGFRTKVYNSRTTCARDWKNYPDAIAAFVERLQGVTVENVSALKLIRQHDKPDTLIYCDPPYVPETRNMKEDSCRYRHDMTEADHRELAAALLASPAMIVLSGYACPLYDELFGDWRQVQCEAFADGARPRTETLWLSSATVQQLHPTLF